MAKSIPGKSHNTCRRSLKVGIREKCVCVAGRGWGAVMVVVEIDSFMLT